MKIHVLQHAPFEGPANIEKWAKIRRAGIEKTCFFENNCVLPVLSSFDALIVMGGPMGANDETAYPWLKSEKQLILQALEANKKVLGICLGAQLIAGALGARVYRNQYKEIGWFPVEVVPHAGELEWTKNLPSPLLVFHWHGDTFDLPSGATQLLRSPVCENQAFVLASNVLGLQFHIEAGAAHVLEFIHHGQDELKAGGPFVQSAAAIEAEIEKATALEPVLDNLLDYFLSPTPQVALKA